MSTNYLSQLRSTIELHVYFWKNFPQPSIQQFAHINLQTSTKEKKFTKPSTYHFTHESLNQKNMKSSQNFQHIRSHTLSTTEGNEVHTNFNI